MDRPPYINFNISIYFVYSFHVFLLRELWTKGVFHSTKTLPLRYSECYQTDRLEFFLHVASDVDCLLVDSLDGEHSAPVDADGRVDGGVTEVRVRVGTERYLTSADQRVHRLQTIQTMLLINYTFYIVCFN